MIYDLIYFTPTYHAPPPREENHFTPPCQPHPLLILHYLRFKNTMPVDRDGETRGRDLALASGINMAQIFQTQ